jgi:hypothetical protein
MAFSFHSAHRPLREAHGHGPLFAPPPTHRLLQEIAMTDPVTDYVRSAARFLDLPLDDAQVERVAGHLTRTKAMVALLHAAPLAPEDEPAELFRPAPFPAQDPA